MYHRDGRRRGNYHSREQSPARATRAQTNAPRETSISSSDIYYIALARDVAPRNSRASTIQSIARSRVPPPLPTPFPPRDLSVIAVRAGNVRKKLAPRRLNKVPSGEGERERRGRGRGRGRRRRRRARLTVRRNRDPLARFPPPASLCVLPPPFSKGSFGARESVNVTLTLRNYGNYDCRA